MPNRYLFTAIVLFWVGANTWLFYRDILPWLGPGEPPPFTIDLAEEALAHSSDIRWKVIKDGKEKGYANTSVRYQNQEDTYELKCEFKLWSGVRAPGIEPDQVIGSTYRVTRDGELREARFEGKLALDTAVITGRFHGKVVENKLIPHLEAEIPFLDMKPWQMEFSPVELSTKGSVLNSLQPLNRLPGLRKGQRWRVPLIDPIKELSRSIKIFGNADLPHIPELVAEVSPQTQFLAWGPKAEEVPCLVIGYRGEDFMGSTWVRESDFTVLQQEANHHGEKLTLVRE